MKVIGINGSARKDGNTSLLIKAVFAELEAEGIENGSRAVAWQGS